MIMNYVKWSMKVRERKETIRFFRWSILDAKLFRKTLALLLAIENRRSNKRVHDDDDDEVNDSHKHSETTEVFKTLSKRLKHGEQIIDEELNKTYEHFVPER